MVDAVSARGNLASGDPDEAWKVLSSVNEWIRHADSKVSITFAAAGALAVALFQLTGSFPASAAWGLYVAPIACAVALLMVAACCTRALVPRTPSPEPVGSGQAAPSANPLFFLHIASRWDQVGYESALRTATADPGQLTSLLAAEIHVNSAIATEKFHWANLAIRSTAVAIVLLSLTALLVLLAR
jgi:hypothetical protein